MRYIDTSELDHPLQGYTITDIDGTLWIPIVVSLEPGNGHVSKFLDNLPTDKMVCFPNVISRKLAGMLTRRGFKPARVYSEEFEETVIVHCRKARRKV